MPPVCARSDRYPYGAFQQLVALRRGVPNPIQQKKKRRINERESRYTCNKLWKGTCQAANNTGVRELYKHRTQRKYEHRKIKKTVAHPCASDPTTTTPWMITPGPTSPAFAQRANDACRAPVHVAGWRHALQPPMLGCWLAAPTPEEAGSADGLAYADSQAG